MKRKKRLNPRTKIQKSPAQKKAAVMKAHQKRKSLSRKLRLPRKRLLLLAVKKKVAHHLQVKAAAQTVMRPVEMKMQLSKLAQMMKSRRKKCLSRASCQRNMHS